MKWIIIGLMICSLALVGCTSWNGVGPEIYVPEPNGLGEYCDNHAPGIGCEQGLECMLTSEDNMEGICVEDEQVNDEYCCESYGIGAFAKPCCFSYEIVQDPNECTIPEGFVGGGKHIVDMDNCLP